MFISIHPYLIFGNKQEVLLFPRAEPCFGVCQIFLLSRVRKTSLLSSKIEWHKVFPSKERVEDLNRSDSVSPGVTFKLNRGR